MKLSYSWLNDFADFNSIPFDTIHEKISLSISEIDDVSEYMEYLEKIIAAKIIQVDKHPDADKLSVCIADIGDKKIQIVTGAKVEVGQIVPLATLGTIFPDGKEIKEGKLRGVDSFGMFCSEKELGLSEESSGLMLLPSDSILGMNLRKILDFEDKIILIDNKSITHRPDLWSHFGFARELSSQLNIPLKLNPYDSKFVYSEIEPPNVIESKNAISYFAVHIQNIEIQKSISKISSRIIRCGIKSINNIVDVSNYVLLEMGQPNHFFDTDKLGKVSLEVDFAKDNEKISLLDKTAKDLNKNILLIRNDKKPVAIAGVMGGDETAISVETKKSILESAIFRREDVRKTIRNTGIRTESAIRYEKGLDSYSCIPVINRSLNLLLENGCPNLKASKPAGFVHEKEDVIIKTSFEFINQKLGTIFDKKVIINILERLGFVIKEESDQLEIKVPKFRHNYDIKIQEDIVEEVGRSLGYAAIDYKPILSEVKPILLNPRRALERKIKSLFVFEFGFNEVFNYSFASEKDNSFEKIDSTSLKLANSMPEEYQFLRTSTYPSIIKNLKLNLDRYTTLKIFEYGRTYHKIKKDELASEERYFTLAYLQNKKTINMEEDFFYLRDSILEVFSLLGLKNIELSRVEKSYFHPNASLELKLEDKILAEIGILHPEKMDFYDLKKQAILAKIDFLNLEKSLDSFKKNKFINPSQFPSGQIDISLVMDESIDTNLFSNKVLDSKILELEDIWVHDIFRSENLGEQKKSITYRASLINYKETFTAESIQNILNKCISIATENGYTLR